MHCYCSEQESHFALQQLSASDNSLLQAAHFQNFTTASVCVHLQNCLLLMTALIAALPVCKAIPAWTSLHPASETLYVHRQVAYC